MAKIEIYTTSLCPYCLMAKRLLNRKGLAFEEIDLWRHPGRRDEMLKRADGRTTVPQIFIEGRGIGGCDDLYALEEAGQLDAMVAGAAS